MFSEGSKSAETRFRSLKVQGFVRECYISADITGQPAEKQGRMVKQLANPIPKSCLALWCLGPLFMMESNLYL